MLNHGSPREPVGADFIWTPPRSSMSSSTSVMIAQVCRGGRAACICRTFTRASCDNCAETNACPLRSNPRARTSVGPGVP
jgi:hypothetical protein